MNDLINYKFEKKKINEFLIFPDNDVIKINQLSTKDNKFSIKHIYIFVGIRLELNLLKIFNKLNENNNVKLTELEEKTLENFYGKDYKKKLILQNYNKEKNVSGGKKQEFDFDDYEEEKILSKKEIINEKNMISYIYDFTITKDDTLIDIKYKIQTITKIPVILQHSFLFENEISYPLDYQINYNELLNIKYDVNMFEYFNFKDKIFNVNIDLNLIELYEKDVITIKNNRFMTLTEWMDINSLNKNGNELMNFYVISFDEFIDKIFDIQEYENTNIETKQFSDFMIGFIYKYYPMISDSTILKKIINKNIDEYLTHKNLNITFGSNAKIINFLSNFENKNDKIEYSLILLSFMIDSDLLGNYKDNIFDLRLLYELIETNDFIFYIEYKNNKQRKIKIYKECKELIDKILEDEKSKQNIDEDDIKTDINSITLKIRRSELQCNDYMNVTINKFGVISIQSNWQIETKYKIENIKKELIPNINKLIDVINSKADLVIKSGFRLRYAQPENIKIKFFNSAILYLFSQNISLNPIIFSALIKILGELGNFFDWKETKIKKNLDNNIAMIVYLNKYKKVSFYKNNKNELNMDIPKYITKKSLKMKIIFDKCVKIEISGIRNLFIFDYVINLMELTINAYRYYIQNKKFKNEIFTEIIEKNIKEYEKQMSKLKNIEYETIKNKKFNKNSINVNNVVDFLLENKKFSKIKLLKNTDPLLFDYETLDTKNKLYSRLCQNNQQPIPISDEGIKKLSSTRDKKYEILRIKNITNPEITNNYICNSKSHPYPGFTNSSKDHPKGYCLLCCRKMNFIKTKKGTAYKRYQECQKTTTNTSETNVEKEEEKYFQNKKYIKGYGKISIDRYSWLPDNLMPIFNKNWKWESTFGLNIRSFDKKTKCNYANIKMIDDIRSQNCYLLYGVEQNRYSIVKIIELLFNTDKLLEKSLKYLEKNNNLFNILNSGLIKKEFKTIENYKKFLLTQSNQIFIKLNHIYDLFCFFLKTHFLILVIDDKTSEIEYPGIFYTHFNTKLLIENGINVCVCIKNEYIYSPITLERKMSFSKKNNDEIIDILLLFLNQNKNISNIEYLPHIDEVIEKIDEIKKNFTSIKQIVSEYESGEIKTTHLYLEGKYNVLLPIYPTNIIRFFDIIPEILYEYPPINIDVEINFLKDFYGEKNINITQFFGNKTHIYGFFINNIVIFCDKILKKKYNKKNNFVNIINIDKITNFKKIDTKKHYNIDDIKFITYNNEIHNILIFELNKILFMEKNDIIRKKIIKEINDIINDNNFIIKIDTIINNYNIVEKDKEKIKKIVILTKNLGLRKIDEIFNKTKFYFDLTKLNQLKEIDSLNEIENELTNIFKDVVDISDTLFKNNMIDRESKSGLVNLCSNKNILKDCNNTILLGQQQCFWNRGKCKIILTHENYKFHLKRLSNEILYNNIIRNKLFQNELSLLENPNIFAYNKNNEIMIEK